MSTDYQDLYFRSYGRLYGRGALLDAHGIWRKALSADHREVTWRSTIDSLAFRPEGHGGVCVVHRRAFKTLLGCSASPEECAAYFSAHQSTFARAAAAKIARASLRSCDNFHLTSRDIARASTVGGE